MSLTRWTPAALAVVLALVLTAAAPAAGTRGGPLDGFTVTHLPDQVGAQASAADFSYEWEDVAFTSRAWEQAKEGGGFQVVLQVLVMRGEEFVDLDAVRTFLARYHERDPDTWELTDLTRDDGAPGLRGDREAFWTPGEGVAVEVRDTSGLLGQEELLATARGVVEEKSGLSG
ncbi:MAG TPA: hypothetical protein K8V84_13005 [Nocardiopsis listeri]|uniref:hypothetical protein n=1 Tax=Nocardiopsis listeri TaxID=53440 RepID=UPI001DC7188E|nr:hypothetical protein [Nocardiopsis listeri]HJE59406.1 hypothetical protein [Nocardiopsis listeri]